MNTRNADSEELLRKLLEKVNEQYKELLLNNGINQKICSKLIEFNYDITFLATVRKHLLTIGEVLQHAEVGNLTYEDLFQSAEKFLRFNIAVFFRNKLEIYSNSTLPFNSHYVEPTESMPIEYFLRPSRETIANFIVNLDKDDLLFAEVVETNFRMNNENFFVSRIISKVGDNTSVYGANLKVYMFRDKEMLRLNREFQMSEVLKVAILGKRVINDNLVFFATTNVSQLKKSDDLDKLLRMESPFNLHHLKEANKYICFAHYLKNHKYFDQKHNLNHGIKSLGLDPYYIYSFNEEEEKLVCPKWFYVGALKNNAVMFDNQRSDKFLQEANEFVKNGDILNALSSFDDALKFWPENYKVYEARGRMYADVHNNQKFYDLVKAQFDFSEALRLNPSSKNIKIELSDIYLCMAKNLKKKKKYEECRKALQASLKINEDNKNATLLLQRVDKKLQSSSSSSSDAELIALQETRKKLLLELSKE